MTTFCRLVFRVRAIAIGCLVSFLWFGAYSASAQDYPNPKRPIRIVVAFTPGSASDITARILAQELQEKLKATVIVDNRPGASGNIGTAHVAQAEPDGYTLLLTVSATHSVNPWLFKSLPYDAINGFTHIALLGQFPQVVIVPNSSPIKSLSDLVAAGKANPEKLFYSFGSQSQRVGSETLCGVGGFKAVAVSYRSPAEAVLATVKAEVQFMMEGLAVALPHIKNDLVRPLAVSTSERTALLPDVPTLEELGYKGYDVLLWMGLAGPPNLPKGISDRLSAAVAEVMQKKEVRERLLQLGITTTYKPSAEYLTFVKQQSEAWRRRIKEAGLEPQ
jgi:tripartite-type tricarboxylate transporter receptor subunit TctC